MLGNRHSSAAQYEVPSQSSTLHEHSDEYVLQLFEQMLVSVCVVCFSCVEDLNTVFPKSSSVGLCVG